MFLNLTIVFVMNELLNLMLNSRATLRKVSQSEPVGCCAVVFTRRGTAREVHEDPWQTWRQGTLPGHQWQLWDGCWAEVRCWKMQGLSGFRKHFALFCMISRVSFFPHQYLFLAPTLPAWNIMAANVLFFNVHTCVVYAWVCKQSVCEHHKW